MPAALQCPDCGHQEMLDHLGGVTTFRCGGCGRALKVPVQFRTDPDARGAAPGSPGSRPPSPVDRTQAMPTVPPASVPPAPIAAPLPGAPTGVPAMAAAGAAGGGLPPGSGLPPLRQPPAAPESLHPPLILRLVLWVIALPLGSLLVFAIASGLKLLTKSQLEDTFLLAGWGRFVPIARLLPFCALATAVIVQLGVFGLERLRARNLRNGPPGRGRPGGGPRTGPARPHSPTGERQRGSGNGARSRDRVTS